MLLIKESESWEYGIYEHRDSTKQAGALKLKLQVIETRIGGTSRLVQETISHTEQAQTSYVRSSYTTAAHTALNKPSKEFSTFRCFFVQCRVVISLQLRFQSGSKCSSLLLANSLYDLIHSI